MVYFASVSGGPRSGSAQDQISAADADADAAAEHIAIVGVGNIRAVLRHSLDPPTAHFVTLKTGRQATASHLLEKACYHWQDAFRPPQKSVHEDTVASGSLVTPSRRAIVAQVVGVMAMEGRRWNRRRGMRFDWFWERMSPKGTNRRDDRDQLAGLSSPWLIQSFGFRQR